MAIVYTSSKNSKTPLPAEPGLYFCKYKDSPRWNFIFRVIGKAPFLEVLFVTTLINGDNDNFSGIYGDVVFSDNLENA